MESDNGNVDVKVLQKELQASKEREKELENALLGVESEMRANSQMYGEMSNVIDKFGFNRDCNLADIVDREFNSVIARESIAVEALKKKCGCCTHVDDVTGSLYEVPCPACRVLAKIKN